MTPQEEYRCKVHEETIKESVNRISALEHNLGVMQVSQARIEENLSYIKAKLENGISQKLELLTVNMNKILPIIESREKTVDIFKNSILVLCISGAAALLLFILRLYLVR